MKERELITLIDQWLEEGDINGTRLNKVNLDRFRMANYLAVQIFTNAEKIEIEEPRQDLSYAETTIITDILEIDRCKQMPMFEKLMVLVDKFSVSPINGKLISISLIVDNIWEE